MKICMYNKHKQRTWEFPKEENLYNEVRLLIAYIDINYDYT